MKNYWPEIVIFGIVAILFSGIYITDIQEKNKNIENYKDSLKNVRLEKNLYKSESSFYLHQLIIQEGANDTSLHNYTPGMVEWAKNTMEEVDSIYTKNIRLQP